MVLNVSPRSPGQELQLGDTPLVGPHGVVQASLLKVPQAHAPVPPARRQERQLGRGGVRSEG